LIAQFIERILQSALSAFDIVSAVKTINDFFDDWQRKRSKRK